jgi:transposase-like protein
VFLDAIAVKVRDNQVVQNKPAYLAVGIDADGEKHVLGIWLAKTPPETLLWLLWLMGRALSSG